MSLIDHVEVVFRYLPLNMLQKKEKTNRFLLISIWRMSKQKAAIRSTVEASSSPTHVREQKSSKNVFIVTQKRRALLVNIEHLLLSLCFFRLRSFQIFSIEFSCRFSLIFNHKGEQKMLLK
jgi:pantothenate kinase